MADYVNGNLSVERQPASYVNGVLSRIPASYINGALPDGYGAGMVSSPVPQNVAVDVNTLTRRDGSVAFMNISVAWETPIDGDNLSGFEINYPAASSPVAVGATLRIRSLQIPADSAWVDIRATYSDRSASEYVRVLREDFDPDRQAMIDPRPQQVEVTEDALGGGRYEYNVDWDAPEFTLRTLDYYEFSIDGALFFRVDPDNGAGHHAFVRGIIAQNIRVRTHFTNGEVSDILQVDRYDYNPDDVVIDAHVVYQANLSAGLDIWQLAWFKPRGYTPNGYQVSVNGGAFSGSQIALSHAAIVPSTGTNNYLLVRANYDDGHNSVNVRINQADWVRLLESHVTVESQPNNLAQRWRINIADPLGVDPVRFEWRHVDNQTWRTVSQPADDQQDFLSTEDGDEWIEVRAVYTITDVGINHTYYSNVIRVNFTDWTNNR